MVIGTYISIITFKVNGLMLQPKDTDWLNGYKKTRPIYIYIYIYIYMLSKRNHFRPQDIDLK